MIHANLLKELTITVGGDSTVVRMIRV